jgi:hypothetical protein
MTAEFSLIPLPPGMVGPRGRWPIPGLTGADGAPTGLVPGRGGWRRRLRGLRVGHAVGACSFAGKLRSPLPVRPWVGSVRCLLARDAMVNRTQALVLGFFLLTVTTCW